MKHSKLATTGLLGFMVSCFSQGVAAQAPYTGATSGASRGRSSHPPLAATVQSRSQSGQSAQSARPTAAPTAIGASDTETAATPTRTQPFTTFRLPSTGHRAAFKQYPNPTQESRQVAAQQLNNRPPLSSYLYLAAGGDPALNYMYALRDQ